ncbi:MAG: phosphoglucosamine mutase [Candidatus Hodarchaeaceae archaeon]|nr:phosphoglucosamine mutase [Candidatus Hodarchaeaceae archaeon]
MPRLFGTFGVRGVSNLELTPKLAFELSSALATHLRNRGVVAVGYDNRTSSEMLEHAIVAGLSAGGCDVLRLGMVPTPVLSFAIKHFGCDAGVMITASHNPPEYNGIKFWDSDGAGFQRSRELEVEGIVSNRAWRRAPWNRIGSCRSADALTPYMRAVLAAIQRIKRKLKVVVDCANAAGSVATPALLTRLGCKVVSLNCQLDGRFPGRPAEPSPENLEELAKTVVACGADLGTAHDGDADRTIVVNEAGEVLTGDRVFALVALHHLQGRERPKILTTVATSSVIDDVATKLCGSIVRTRVGEPAIIEHFRKHGGDIGGEENGGVIFFDWTPCRDGILTAAKLVEALAASGMSMSGLDATLPRYHQSKRRIRCPEELKPKVLKALERRFSRYELDRTDGLRVSFEDGWLLLRPSGTEPIFRCFAEARDGKRAEDLAKLGMRELKACVRKLS